MAAPRNDDVRGQILEAAEALISTKTLSKVTLLAIAQKAGISKGTLYYHFRTKEEIYLSLMDKYLEEQWTQLLAWVGNRQKDSSLPRLFKYILERESQQVGIRIHFLLEALHGNEPLRLQILQRYQEFAEKLAEQIRIRHKDIDAHYLAWTVLLLADGLLLHQQLHNPQLETATYIQETEAAVRFLVQHFREEED